MSVFERLENCELNHIDDAIEVVCTYCTPDPDGCDCDGCHVRKLWDSVCTELNKRREN